MGRTWLDASGGCGKSGGTQSVELVKKAEVSSDRALNLFAKKTGTDLKQKEVKLDG